jgi:hypothetical protein
MMASRNDPQCSGRAVVITPSSARVLHGAFIACVLFLLISTAALAGLPPQRQVQTLEPLHSELFPPNQEPASPPADLHFGQTIDIRNGMAFVSMPTADPGRVGIYTLTGSSWVRTATIVSPDASPGANFGRSLTFRDGALIVGTTTAAYVYKRANGAWKFSQKLVPPAADNIVLFAEAMRYEAGELAISALDRTTLRGSVYVFEIDATTGKFVRRARVRAADGFARDFFGKSLAVTTGTLVVGESPEPSGTAPLSAAYVFKRTATGQWVQRQKLMSIGETVFDGFGVAVAMDNGMILVGAPRFDAEGGPIGPPTSDDHIASGAVYGFVPVNGYFVETFKLRPRPDELFRYDGFGEKLAMFGSRIAVSAHDIQADSHAPQAFVLTYSRSGNAVVPVGLAAPVGETAANSIAIANNWLLIGSPFSGCGFFGCIGEANIFDLLHFAP